MNEIIPWGTRVHGMGIFVGLAGVTKVDPDQCIIIPQTKMETGSSFNRVSPVLCTYPSYMRVSCIIYHFFLELSPRKTNDLTEKQANICCN